MSRMSDQRWSIHIDIEGFGALWKREDRVVQALGDLMEGIYWIGTRASILNLQIGSSRTR